MSITESMPLYLKNDELPVKIMHAVGGSCEEELTLEEIRANPNKQLIITYGEPIVFPVGFALRFWVNDQSVGEVTIIQHNFFEEDEKIKTRIRCTHPIFDSVE